MACTNITIYWEIHIKSPLVPEGKSQTICGRTDGDLLTAGSICYRKTTTITTNSSYQLDHAHRPKAPRQRGKAMAHDHDVMPCAEGQGFFAKAPSKGKSSSKFSWDRDDSSNVHCDSLRKNCQE